MFYLLSRFARLVLRTYFSPVAFRPSRLVLRTHAVQVTCTRPPAIHSVNSTCTSSPRCNNTVLTIHPWAASFSHPLQLLRCLGRLYIHTFRWRLSEAEAVHSPVDVGQSVGPAPGVRGDSRGGVRGFAGRGGIGAGRLEGDQRRTSRLPVQSRLARHTRYVFCAYVANPAYLLFFTRKGGTGLSSAQYSRNREPNHLTKNEPYASTLRPFPNTLLLFSALHQGEVLRFRSASPGATPWGVGRRRRAPHGLPETSAPAGHPRGEDCLRDEGFRAGVQSRE